MSRPQLRERYAARGPHHLSDAELLALVIGTGAAGRSALHIGQGLLARFTDLTGLAEAPALSLAHEPGLGPVRATRLHAALALGRRAVDAPILPRPTVLSPEDAVRALGGSLQGHTTERCVALYLERSGRLLHRREVSHGSAHCTVVGASEVFRPALLLRASALVIAHNHPSGDPTPSAADRSLTRNLADAGKTLGVPLLDHIVVGGSRWVSMAEQGWVPQAAQATLRTAGPQTLQYGPRRRP